MKRKFYWVKAKKLRPSSILPKREHDLRLSDSVKKDGVQQPIIARPIPGREDEFEIMDGLGRVERLDGDTKMLADVRYEVKDVDVFKISETTFKRTARTTYEKARFYRLWVDAQIKETGKERGAQKRVAEEAGLSEAEVSHYLSISKLFDRLRTQNIPEANFNVLKNQALNKLYALARVKDEKAMLEVATKMAETPDMVVEELKALIKEQTSPLREIERSLLEDNEKEEESESSRIDRLTTAAQELEGALHKIRETLTVFTSRIIDKPEMFLSPGVIERIRKMLNALKKIEKEANRVIGSGKKSHQHSQSHG